MMKDIKNLIFDFGGVLINLDRTACRETFEKLGIESIHESVLDDYRQKELYMQLESGNISAAAFRASSWRSRRISTCPPFKSFSSWAANFRSSLCTVFALHVGSGLNVRYTRRPLPSLA